jgi:hypothetical protein
VATYDVRYDASSGNLRVEGAFEAGAGQAFTVDRGAEPFVRDLVALDPASGRALGRGVRDASRFEVPACARAACRVRYTFALHEAGRTLDDLDVASLEGEVAEAPPSTWLLAPTAPDRAARVRVRVRADAPSQFVTGLHASPHERDVWEVSLHDLARSPYSAFGPMRTSAVAFPGGALQLAIAPGALAVDDARLEAWTRATASAVAGYFGRFPMPGALLLIVPAGGPWVGMGRTLAGGGGSIFLRLGDEATSRHLDDDWVLVHEMIHLAFPSVPREQNWAEEGLATYVEPVARARAGAISAEDAWTGMVAGLPQGLPQAGDRGLDRTPTWGRTYWGGALFWLLADVGFRKATGNARGLEHGLRALVERGMTNATTSALDDALTVADAAAQASVLVPLHVAMGASPHPVDLDALWKDLGVVKRAGKPVAFDESAPSAAIRQAITASPRPAQPSR